MASRIIYVIVGILMITLVFASQSIKIGNGAYVDNFAGSVEQYPETLDKDTEAQVMFETKLKEKDYTLCFDFPVDTDNIIIHSAVKKQYFGFSNEDLKEIAKEKNRLCIKDFSNSKSVELRYKMEYVGEGTIKYNVTLLPSKYSKDYDDAKESSEIVILDPYLVGSLSTSNNLLMRFPFDGNSNVAWSVSMINVSSTSILSYQETANSSVETDRGGQYYITNPTQGYDNNWGTYSFTHVHTSCSSEFIGSYEFMYNKLDTELSQVWQVSDGTSPVKTYNLTPTPGCYNSYSDRVYYYIGMYGSGAYSCDTETNYIRYYCWDNSLGSYTLLHEEAFPNTFLSKGNNFKGILFSS